MNYALPTPQSGRGTVEGTVRWFNNTKGYGFIGRENGPDVFVHYTAIVSDGYKTLNEGDKVEFGIVQGPKGLQAGNVTKLSRLQPPAGYLSNDSFHLSRFRPS